MSPVIQFLDAAGSNAQMSPADYDASVAMLQIHADQKQALLDRDSFALTALLDGRSKMCCHITAPDGDESEPLQDDEDDLPEREE